METEAIASAKAGEQVAVARDILRAFGVLPERPTLIGTDNLANFKVATGIGCPSRSRHFLRRYFVLKRRIASGEVTMIHVPDVEMPADCLTKWLPSAKLRRSVEYMTGARVAPTANTGQVIEMSAIEGAIAHVSEARPTAAHGDAGAASGHPHRGNRSGDSVGGSVVGRVPGWGASVTEPTPVTRVVVTSMGLRRPAARACLRPSVVA